MSVFFAILGSAHVKAVRKKIGEFNPRRAGQLDYSSTGLDLIYGQTPLHSYIVLHVQADYSNL